MTKPLHPPLHALLQQAQTDAEIWLPARLHSGRQGWIWCGIQRLEDVKLCLYVLLALSFVMSLAQAWWLFMALIVATAFLAQRWAWKDPANNSDLPLEWNGWHIDVAQRTLARMGVLADEAAQQIGTLQLEPADAWSVGVLMGDPGDHQAIYAWHIELRHRSRGPVAVLCVVHSTSAAKQVRQDIDALVDTVAQRLGIRRTGSRLLPLKR